LIRGEAADAAEELLEPGGRKVPGLETGEGPRQAGHGRAGVPQCGAGRVEGDPAGFGDEDRVGVAVLVGVIPEQRELAQLLCVATCLLVVSGEQLPGDVGFARAGLDLRAGAEAVRSQGCAGPHYPARRLRALVRGALAGESLARESLARGSSGEPLLHRPAVLAPGGLFLADRRRRGIGRLMRGTGWWLSGRGRLRR